MSHEVESVHLAPLQQREAQRSKRGHPFLPRPITAATRFAKSETVSSNSAAETYRRSVLLSKLVSRPENNVAYNIDLAARVPDDPVLVATGRRIGLDEVGYYSLDGERFPRLISIYFSVFLIDMWLVSRNGPIGRHKRLAMAPVDVLRGPNVAQWHDYPAALRQLLDAPRLVENKRVIRAESQNAARLDVGLRQTIVEFQIRQFHDDFT
jgi:hypothetical protein